MKKDWENRLIAVEQRTRFLYSKERFQEWLQENHQNYQGNYWDLLDIVPIDFRIECLDCAIEKQKSTAKSDLTTNE